MSALGRPGSERLHHLRQRHRGADHVRRLGDDDRGGRIHHHHEFLRLRRDVGGGERVRRQQESSQQVDAVAHDQLLRQPFGDVGRRAADVAADDLDLLAGDGVAVLLHVGLDAVVELDAGIGELAGQNVDQSDLDRALRVGRRRRQRREGKRWLIQSATVASSSSRSVLLQRTVLAQNARSNLISRDRVAAGARPGGAPRPPPARIACPTRWDRGRTALVGSRSVRQAVAPLDAGRETPGRRTLIFPPHPPCYSWRHPFAAKTMRTARFHRFDHVFVLDLVGTRCPRRARDRRGARTSSGRSRTGSACSAARPISSVMSRPHRGDGVLAAERRLARESDGRGWARDTVERLCVDRAGSCSNSAIATASARPISRRATIASASCSPAACRRTKAASGPSTTATAPPRQMTAPCTEEVKLRVRARPHHARQRRHRAARRHRPAGRRARSRCATC